MTPLFLIDPPVIANAHDEGWCYANDVIGELQTREVVAIFAAAGIDPDTLEEIITLAV